MVNYLVDVENSTDKLIQNINNLKESGTEIELLQAEFLLAIVNN
jgi:hypothetical protein